MPKFEHAVHSSSPAPVDMGNKAGILTLLVAQDASFREELRGRLSHETGIVVVCECSDGKSALENIRELGVKLVIADVEVGRLDGFEMLEQLDPSERPLVVFISASDRYAVRAFELGVVDYLVKPVTKARLSLALQRARTAATRSPVGHLTRQVEQLLEHVRRLDGQSHESVSKGKSSGKSDQLLIKADGAVHFIKTADIIFVEAQGDFVKIQMTGKTQLVRETLQSFERRMDAEKFLRIHRSFLVNLQHVNRVETALYGDHAVYVSNGTKLRLSRTYRGKLKALVSTD